MQVIFSAISRLPYFTSLGVWYQAKEAGEGRVKDGWTRCEALLERGWERACGERKWNSMGGLHQEKGDLLASASE
jgi:hypothetical protein